MIDEDVALVYAGRGECSRCGQGSAESGVKLWREDVPHARAWCQACWRSVGAVPPTPRGKTT